jgi:hypothetical protein
MANGYPARSLKTRVVLKMVQSSSWRTEGTRYGGSAIHASRSSRGRCKQKLTGRLGMYGHGPGPMHWHWHTVAYQPATGCEPEWAYY